MPRTTTLLVLAGVMLAGTGMLSAQVLFTVTDLGTLGGTNSRAADVNNAGQVVGFSTLAGEGSSHAFSYTAGGGLVDLGTLGGTYSSANGINATGQIVGSSSNAGDTTTQAFLYNGTMTGLGTLGGSNSHGAAINNAGAITGYSQPAGDGTYRAYVYPSGGSMTALASPDPVNDIVFGMDINSSGVVAGSGRFYEPPGIFTPYVPRTFTNTGGTTTVSTTNGGDSASIGVSINDAGYLVGTYLDPGFYQYSILAAPGSPNYASLFAFYLGRDEANDINNTNIVVGAANLLQEFDPAYAYRYDMNLSELGNLNDQVNLAGSGFAYLNHANAISDNGLIVGYGTTTGGDTHAFLLTPNNAVKFWDGNGTTAGLGQVSGTWSLTAGNWTTNTTGTAAGNGWTNGDFARFLNNTSDITVNLTDNVSASGLLYTSGNTGVTITGGSTLTLVNDAMIKVGNTQKGIDLNVVVAGTAGLVKEGNGTLRLSGANTYTGETVLHGGDLFVAHDSALGATGADNETIVDGGQIRFDTSVDIAESFIVQGGNFALTVEPDFGDFTARDVTLTGPIKLVGNAGLGGGNPLYNASLTVTNVISEDTEGMRDLFVFGATLTGANTFTGHITAANEGVTVNTINANSTPGPLGMGSGIALGYQSEGPVDGTLHYAGATAATTRTIQLEGGYGTVDVVNAGTTLTLDGLISGGGTFAKSGAGAVHLLNPNTYTGGTVIDEGILRIANTTGSALGTDDVLVNAAGILTGPGTFPGDLWLQGHYAPGDSPALVTLPGSVTINAGGYIDFEIGGLLRGTQYDALDIGGTFNSSGSLSLTLISGFSPALGDSFNLLAWETTGEILFANLNLPVLSAGLYWETGLLASTGTLNVAAVPEPSTYALLFAGLLLLGLGRWRRR